jgi:hypothetical protein
MDVRERDVLLIRRAKVEAVATLSLLQIATLLKSCTAVKL